MMFPVLAAAALFASSAVAAPEPSEPSGATVAAVGSELTTMWAKDTAGGWSDTTIRLMSGNNFDFKVVTPIATGIDASQLDSYTFKVPDVNPTSQIYFLLFNPTNATDFALATYSTRFTISGADGSVSQPENPTQPSGGAAIPWGVGNLTTPYQITSPSNNTASGATGSSGSGSGSQSVAMMSSTAAAATSSAASRAASAVESASAAVGSSGASAVSAAGSAKASATSATNMSGAMSRVGGVGGIVALVGAAAVAQFVL